MSNGREMLAETAAAVFESLGDRDFAAGWPIVAAAGFASLLLPEADDGFGGDFGDLFAVQRLAGLHAVPLPIGETIIANRLLVSDGGAAVASASLAPSAIGELAGDRFTGMAKAVPWGRHVDYVLAPAGEAVVVLARPDAKVREGSSPAGEPRDSLSFDAAPARRIAATAPGLDALGAMLRAGQIAGALDRALALAIDHANQRQQFGKPLAKFQAVQQNLSILAVEAAAVNSAATAAALAMDRGREDSGRFEIAAAKLRANMAVGIGTGIAHQVHGAIGFTHEYPLHLVTRRMMGWRSEFGNDRFWADELGAATARLGGAGLWTEITRRGDIA